MRDRYLFIVGGRLAVLGGDGPGILTIARRGICMFGPGGTVIRASLLAITTWGLTDTRVLSSSCGCLQFVTGAPGPRKTRAPGRIPRPAPLNGPGQGVFLGIPCPRPRPSPRWVPVENTW